MAARQDPVELAGRDPLAPLAPDVDGGLEDAPDALAGLGADRDDRREIEERDLVADPLDVLVEGPVGLVLDEVPLVDRDDQALALLDDVARDVGVLRRQPLDRIDDEDRDVRPRQRMERAQGRVPFSAAGPPATLPRRRIPAVSIRTTSLRPQASRVSIASRVVPGHLGHDRPLLAEQRVEQRSTCRRSAGRRTRSRPARSASAAIAASHLAASASTPSRSGASAPSASSASPASGSPTTNGSSRPAAISSAQASASASRALRASSASVSGGSAQTIASSRSPVPRPCERGDRVRLLPAERVELGALELALLVVGLVDDDDHRRRGAAQDPRRLEVRRGRAGRRVDDEQDDVGLGDGEPGLLLDARLDRVVGVELEAAGVDDDEAPAVPLGVAVQPVAGRPRAVLDDRRALAEEPVEQRALADVRSPDDGDDRDLASSSARHGQAAPGAATRSAALAGGGSAVRWCGRRASPPVERGAGELGGIARSPRACRPSRGSAR